jgi:bifunctional DNA-binding transcriptional regulator/antitoxin component of YhaV-PrlF toxin-antitoxin module
MGEPPDRITRHDEQYEFLRQITIPEEDRAKYGIPRSQGGYRWFRSSNIVCLEKARRSREHQIGPTDQTPVRRV